MADSLYTLLDIESYQFRVLQILPGEKGSIIQCRLQRHVLINPPRYDALSYCWGDETNKRAIMVDGINTKITENLEHALQHLRENGTDLLWVDALCINQKDDQEKSFQIRNMKQIYAEAETTYSWLGNSVGDCAATGIHFLRRLQHDASLLVESPHLGCRSAIPKSTDSDSKLLIDLNQPTDSCRRCEVTRYFDALSDICNRPYWRRRWVIQEMTVASHAKIICENEMMDIDDLFEALELCSQSSYWIVPETVCLPMERTHSLRQSYHNGSPLSLCGTLLDTRFHGSKDRRDNLYALLGICSDAHELVPRPSYQQPLELVSI